MERLLEERYQCPAGPLQHIRDLEQLVLRGNDTYTDADGRKVAGHETGHVSSMGHTSYTALMHQGPENFYLLQSNDVAGLQAIYPGNYP